MSINDKLLKDINLLEQDLKTINKNLPYLTGLRGEILVLNELQKYFKGKGIVRFGSSQTKADFVLEKNADKSIPINIEVKTSTFKQEGFGNLYGFAINPKKCRRHRNKKDFCYFDYLITVPLRENFKKQKFYIFPRNFVERHKKKLRNKSKRFRSIMYRIIFLSKNYKKSKMITKFDIWLTKNKKRFENAWAIIK